jgi:hypothetical protein
MRIIGNIDIPCGCQTRKYIMFTKGQLGIVEAAILAAVVAAVVLARHHK